MQPVYKGKKCWVGKRGGYAVYLSGKLERYQGVRLRRAQSVMSTGGDDDVLFTVDRQADPQTPFDRLYFVGRALSDPRVLDGQQCRDTVAMLAHGPLPL